MALENSTKEAMYALDATNPLSLYDCLVPELEAHRPLKLPNFNFKKIVHDNNEAKLKLAELELKLVSPYLPKSLLTQTFVLYYSANKNTLGWSKKTTCCKLKLNSLWTSSKLYNGTSKYSKVATTPRHCLRTSSMQKLQ